MKVKKYTRKNAQTDLPVRKSSSNKSQNGKCLIIGGSMGMWGAAVLCATVASRVGAGYVYLLENAKKFPISQNPDFLILKNKAINYSKFQSIAIGPGLQNPIILKKTLLKLIKSKYPAVVLDAAALDFITKLNLKFPSSWILTPHEGELARMLKVNSETIRQNRKKYIQIAQKKWGCLVLLKGFRTLICTGDKIWEIQAGNPALAKAGTGDVLTGMIAGLMAQGLPSLKAACLAAFIHGLIADRWIESGNDVLSLMASDLIKELPNTLYEIRNVN